MKTTFKTLSQGILALILSAGFLAFGPVQVSAAPTGNPAGQAPKISVSGTVRDVSGQPVLGAGVFEKGTTNGTVSDVNGRFTLTVASNGVLVISCIGYLTKEVPVTGSTVDIVLEEDKELLEEVVVIGYGETTRRNFTGSVAKVEMKDSPLAMVSSSNATRWVVASNFTSGSLKPIWAFLPMPSTCRSMPPALAIISS